MPRLSQALDGINRANNAQAARDKPSPSATEGPTSEKNAVTRNSSAVGSRGSPIVAISGGDGSRSIRSSDAHLVGAAAREAEETYRKRIEEHGPRLFRQSDGSLASERPPNNHYSVATRKKWKNIVEYCQRNGGVREVASTGRSFRYNIGVDHGDHCAVMAALKLAPEVSSDGTWSGLDDSKTSNPLDDPSHILNMLKKQMHLKYEW